MESVSCICIQPLLILKPFKKVTLVAGMDRPFGNAQSQPSPSPAFIRAAGGLLDLRWDNELKTIICHAIQKSCLFRRVQVQFVSTRYVRTQQICGRRCSNHTKHHHAVEMLFFSKGWSWSNWWKNEWSSAVLIKKKTCPRLQDVTVGQRFFFL